MSADDESDSDAEEEQTTVRADSSCGRAKQLPWGLLVGRCRPSQKQEKGLEERAAGSLAAA